MKSSRGIDYRFDGDENRPVLLFSNSLGTDYSMWDRQIEELKSSFRLLRYNTDGLKVNSIEDLGEQVVTLLDELKIEKVHYCGISLGGLIGMWLAAHRPERFLSFTLANTSPKIATADIWESRIQLVKREGLAPVAQASPSRWFTEEFTRRNPEVVQKSLVAFNSTPPQSYINCCEVLKKTDLWSLLPQIQARVLIIAGEHDLVTTVNEAKKMREALTNAQVIILPAAHLSNIEATGFTEALKKNLI